MTKQRDERRPRTTIRLSDAWRPSSALPTVGSGLPDPDGLLDGPTISYEAKDPPNERKAIPLRLGKRDRDMLDEICENIGVTRSRFYRVITRITHQEILNTPDSRLKKLLSEHFREKRADRRRRRRFANRGSD
jgi:hypothetical protein